MSFDLIYARHRNQSVEEWQQELKVRNPSLWACSPASHFTHHEYQRALELAAGHISLYTLTLEPGTAFHRRAFQPASPDDACDAFLLTASVLLPLLMFLCLAVPYPDEERVADLYEATVRTAEEAGYLQYEVSNYAKPGHESRYRSLAAWAVRHEISTHAWFLPSGITSPIGEARIGSA